MIIRGKISIFGGKHDSSDPRFSDVSQGLSFYEHWEANLRPDLFNPRDGQEGTFKRLRDDALYFACRAVSNKDVDLPKLRRALQDHKFTISSEHADVKAYLCDWGPDAGTGRALDLSPSLANALQVETDDICECNFDLDLSKIL